MDVLLGNLRRENVQQPTSESRLLYTYRPFIKGAHEVTILLRGNHLFAKIEGQKNCVPVLTDLKFQVCQVRQLKKILSFFHPITEKTKGILSHIRLTQGLPGGLPHLTLPPHSEYAIGNVIHESYLCLPKLNKELAEKELQIANKMTEIAEKKNTDNRGEKNLQGELDALCAELNTLNDQFKDIQKRIVEAKQNDQKVKFDKALPINRVKSIIKLVHNSSYSENFTSFVIDIKHPHTLSELSSKITKIFSLYGSLSHMPTGMIETVCGDICNMVSAESQVVFIGSFVTLAKSKVMDPIIIRENAEIEEEWMKSPKSYVVLAETVLGGSFLGYCKILGGTNSENIIDESSHTSRVISLSVKSLGAIAKIDAIPNVNSLRESYDSWKNTLINDPHGGYPIGYKYRNLNNILIENDLL